MRYCLHLSGSPQFGKDSLFGEGYFTVQDESSQLIGHLVQPKENELIFDACSGLGGKTSHLSELSNDKCNIIAIDRNLARLKKAQSSFKRMGHQNIKVVCKDFLNFDPKQKADKVLLDSPCSGLGVLKRHPEGKWLKKPHIVNQCHNLQKELIIHALKLLKPEGELVYSVCSFEPEESLTHLIWLKEQFNDKIEIVSPLERIPDYYKRFVTRELLLLILSGNQDNMDGFASFIIRKKS